MIGDQNAAQRVTARIGGRQAVVDYLPWLAYGPESLARDDVVTGELQRIHLNSAGSIQARDGATTTIEPLIILEPARDGDRRRQAPHRSRSGAS